MLAKRGACIAATVAICTQSDVTARYPAADLVRIDLHVVGCRNIRARTIRQALFDVTLARLFAGMQLIPTICFKCVMSQFVETRYGPYVGRNTEVLFQQLGCGQNLAQNRTGAHQLRPNLALPANL